MKFPISRRHKYLSTNIIIMMSWCRNNSMIVLNLKWEEHSVRDSFKRGLNNQLNQKALYSVL